MCALEHDFFQAKSRKSAKVIKIPSIHVGIMPTVQTRNNKEWNFSISFQYGRYSVMLKLKQFHADPLSYCGLCV